MTQMQQAMQFTAPSGKSFVYLTELPICYGEVLYSPDGVTFYELASGGFQGSTIEHDLTFEFVQQGLKGTLHHEAVTVKYDAETYQGYAITYDGETYAGQKVTFDPSNVVPLPDVRRTEYLCLATDNSLLYVSASKYNFTYESFKLFVGFGQNMREIPIQSVQRMRDGGTTYIKTPEGTFYSPSPSGQQQFPKPVPTWRHQPLTDLDASDFDIVETLKGDIEIIRK